jgi:hypothetical protein
LPGYSSSRLSECNLAMIGSLNRPLGLPHAVQEGSPSQARQIREKSAIRHGLARARAAGTTSARNTYKSSLSIRISSNQSPSPFSLAGRSPSTNHALMLASGLANRSLGCLMRARFITETNQTPLKGMFGCWGLIILRVEPIHTATSWSRLTGFHNPGVG